MSHEEQGHFLSFRLYRLKLWIEQLALGCLESRRDAWTSGRWTTAVLYNLGFALPKRQGLKDGRTYRDTRNDQAVVFVVTKTSGDTET